VQNDMSMADVAPLGAENMCEEIVSTGTDEVGIRREEMSGVVRACWEDGSLVIAKGMGNYETISEFDRERPVIYIMNVKCNSVAEALGRKVGEYIAIAGEEHG
jgi:damage-control phosphatase, subfamily I